MTAHRGTVAVIIPARLASTRLPGKPLLAATGKPLILHVLENARGIRQVDTLLVATDDTHIQSVVTSAGFQAVLTSSAHRTGTDRIAEAASGLSADLIVNLQGDEPDVDTVAVAQLIETMRSHPDIAMGTLATPLRDEAMYQSAAVVKVVCDCHGRALYFSRAGIPYYRQDNTRPAVWAYKHLGVYVYRAEFLRQFAAWPPTPLEQAESLEQLRALEHRAAIHVVITPHDSIGIDTAADYDRFVHAYQARANTTIKGVRAS